MQMSPWAATPGDTSSSAHVTHLLLQPTILKTPGGKHMHIPPKGWPNQTVRYATSPTGENEHGPRAITHK